MRSFARTLSLVLAFSLSTSLTLAKVFACEPEAKTEVVVSHCHQPEPPMALSGAGIAKAPFACPLLLAGENRAIWMPSAFSPHKPAVTAVLSRAPQVSRPSRLASFDQALSPSASLPIYLKNHALRI